MSKISNKVKYYIKNPVSKKYIKLEGENIVCGNNHGQGDEYLFVAIQTEAMAENTEGSGYAFNPKDLPEDYVNNQLLFDNFGNEYYAAVANVSEPYMFNIYPYEEKVEVEIYTTPNSENVMTMPTHEGAQITFEAKSNEKKDRQKWVFVRRPGTPDQDDDSKKDK